LNNLHLVMINMTSL